MTETDSSSASGGEVEPRSELRSLTGAVRRHAEWLERMGVYAAPWRTAGDAPAEAEPGEAGLLGEVGAAPEAPEALGEVGPAPGAADHYAPADADGEDRIATHRPSLAVVREDLGECTRCKLSSTRTNIVFGVGAPDAPLLFVGEAPGADEDRRGEPFVGAAGQLLDRMIGAMGWTRETVYIANIVKCRPPGNRDPEPDEVAQCLPFLYRQIDALGPRLIVALGRPSAQALLQTSASISALRGRFHDFRGIPLMPTFHPAFLLRSPDRKRDAWGDLKQVIDELERIGVRPPLPPRA